MGKVLNYFQSRSLSISVQLSVHAMNIYQTSIKCILNWMHRWEIVHFIWSIILMFIPFIVFISRTKWTKSNLFSSRKLDRQEYPINRYEIFSEGYSFLQIGDLIQTSNIWNPKYETIFVAFQNVIEYFTFI